MALTLTMYFRRAVERFMAPRSRLTSRNGAVTLHSCTSSISSGSTSSTTWVQLLIVARSGTSPPASIAVPEAIRSSEAEPVDRAREVMASPARTGCPSTLLARASGCLSCAWPKVTSSGPPLAGWSAAGSGSSSASTRGL